MQIRQLLPSAQQVIATYMSSYMLGRQAGEKNITGSRYFILENVDASLKDVKTESASLLKQFHKMLLKKLATLHGG